MIVCDFHLMCPVDLPYKADAILVVDSDAVFSDSIAFEGF